MFGAPYSMVLETDHKTVPGWESGRGDLAETNREVSSERHRGFVRADGKFLEVCVVWDPR